MSRMLKIAADGPYRLTEDDCCYYFGEYTVGAGYQESDMNQLILNLKKNLTAPSSQLKYKHEAITLIANLLKQQQLQEHFPDSLFIPVPPSSCKTDTEKYDDRLIQILEQAGLPYSEIVSQKKPYTSSHDPDSKRISPDELMNIYEIDRQKVPGVKKIKKLIVFDDVITTGSHFRAMKGMLQGISSEVEVLGLFIARAIEKPFSEFKEEGWQV